MSVIALVLLAVVLAAVAVGLHTGPHGLLASGAFGVVACAALIVLAVTGQPTAAVWGILAAVGTSSGLALAAGGRTMRRIRVHPLGTGAATLRGAEGVAITDLSPFGRVRVRGESWSAESLSGPLRAGAVVHVVNVEGLRLRVWSEEGGVRGIAPEIE